MQHLTTAELDAAIDHIRLSPAVSGTVDLIVRRPAVEQREVLEEAQLDPAFGVVGDTWGIRGSKRTKDGSPHADMQLNVMNSRVIALIAREPDRWALAGDQLYVDLDLSIANLPAGTRLQVGTATIEVTDQSHTGCAKFTKRFGLDAFRWVNAPTGSALRLRGLNAKVVAAGVVHRGDTIVKLGDPGDAAAAGGEAAAGSRQVRTSSTARSVRAAGS